MKQTAILTSLCLAIVIFGHHAQADNFYWDGNAGDFDWGTAANWSSTSPANTDPVSPPGAGDEVIWARDGSPATSICIGDTREIALWKTTTVTQGGGTSNVFPFISGNAGSVLTITGMTTDLVGEFVNIPNVPYVVISDDAQSTTFDSSVSIAVPGGQDNAVMVSGGIQLKLSGGIQETSPGAGLVKYGYNDLTIESHYGLTGDLIVNQGFIDPFVLIDTPGSLIISDGSLGDYRGFKLNGSAAVQYKFGGATANGVTIPNGNYTSSQLNTLVGANVFQGGATLVVVPEPTSIGLLAMGLCLFTIRSSQTANRR